MNFSALWTSKDSKEKDAGVRWMLVLLWGSQGVLELAAHETEDAFIFHLSWKGAVLQLCALSVLRGEWGLGVCPGKIPTHPAIQLSCFIWWNWGPDEGTELPWATQGQRVDLNHDSWTSLCGHVIKLFLDFSRSTWIYLIVYPFEVTLSSWCMPT